MSIRDLAHGCATAVLETVGRAGVQVDSASVRRGPRVLTVSLLLSDTRHLRLAMGTGPQVGLAVGVDGVVVGQRGRYVDVQIPLPSSLWQSVSLSAIAVHGHRAAIGVSDGGRPVVVDLDRTPHLLVAGETGCGKSVALQSMICGLVWGSPVETTRLVLIDGKGRDLLPFSRLANLDHPVVVDPVDAAAVLRAVEGQIAARQAGVRTDARLIVVVDEVAELLVDGARSPAAQSLGRIARVGRGLGVHLVLATQHPTADAFPRQVEVNCARLVGRCGDVSAGIKAAGGRSVGAHLLGGDGDFLLLDGDVTRVQVSMPTADELEQLPVADDVPSLDVGERDGDLVDAPHPSQAPKPVRPVEVAWVLARYDEDGRMPGINAVQRAVGAMDDPPCPRCGEARARRVIEWAQEIVASRASQASGGNRPPLRFPFAG